MLLKIFLLINCAWLIHSQCIIENDNNMLIYALCSGLYTIENATDACNQNGYELVQDNQTVYSVVTNIFK